MNANGRIASGTGEACTASLPAPTQPTLQPPHPQAGRELNGRSLNCVRGGFDSFFTKTNLNDPQPLAALIGLDAHYIRLAAEPSTFAAALKTSTLNRLCPFRRRPKVIRLIVVTRTNGYPWPEIQREAPTRIRFVRDASCMPVAGESNTTSSRRRLGSSSYSLRCPVTIRQSAKIERAANSQQPKQNVGEKG